MLFKWIFISSCLCSQATLPSSCEAAWRCECWKRTGRRRPEWTRRGSSWPTGTWTAAAKWCTIRYEQGAAVLPHEHSHLTMFMWNSFMSVWLETIQADWLCSKTMKWFDCLQLPTVLLLLVYSISNVRFLLCVILFYLYYYTFWMTSFLTHYNFLSFSILFIFTIIFGFPQLLLLLSYLFLLLANDYYFAWGLGSMLDLLLLFCKALFVLFYRKSVACNFLWVWIVRWNNSLFIQQWRNMQYSDSTEIRKSLVQLEM